MRRMSRLAFFALALVGASGCYHYSFEQAPAPTRLTSAGATAGPRQTVTYEESVPTYLNGFVGTGRVDTWKYCAEPVRTELRVTGSDVALSVMTLLIYTPHTLYVTCEKQ